MKHNHYGHRERTRQLFLQAGPAGLPDHMLLEILLYSAIPQRDTNDLAHQLLNTFGSVKGVLEADVQLLQQVPGVGYNTAVMLKTVLALFSRYMRDGQDSSRVLNTSEKIGRYMLPIFLGKTDESVYLLCFDDRFSLLKCECIGGGSHNAVQVNRQKIAERAVVAKSNLVAIAHNHPGGVAMPSDEDIHATLEIYKTLRDLNIQLFDHIIVAGDDFVSLRDSNLFVGL